MSQILVNSVVTTAAVLPICLDVFLVYRLFRFFPFTSAAVLSLAPYLLAVFGRGERPLVGVAGALLAILALAGLTGWFFASRMPRRGSSTLYLFLFSLGLMVVVQNVVAIFFGRQPLPLHFLEGDPYSLGSFGVLGPPRLGMLMWAALTLGITLWLQYFTRMGLYWRGLADDRELAEIVGLEPRKPLLTAFCLGALMTGGAGALLAADTAMTPQMGLRTFMIAVVAVVVGGQKLSGVVLATLLVAVVQQVGGYLLGGRWQDVVVFSILLGFLILRPRGLSATSNRAQTV